MTSLRFVDVVAQALGLAVVEVNDRLVTED